MARAATYADLSDDGQNNILCDDALTQTAIDAHGHRLRLVLQQCLCGQHMPDLAGADAESQRTECAVCASVAIPTDDGHARLRQALLRPDDMHDALIFCAERIHRDAEVVAVLCELVKLLVGLHV